MNENSQTPGEEVNTAEKWCLPHMNNGHDMQSTFVRTWTLEKYSVSLRYHIKLIYKNLYIKLEYYTHNLK